LFESFLNFFSYGVEGQKNQQGMPNAGEGVQGQNQHFLCCASGEELQAPNLQRCYVISRISLKGQKCFVQILCERRLKYTSYICEPPNKCKSKFKVPFGFKCNNKTRLDNSAVKLHKL